MPSASYYREQARLLLEWAESLRATDPVTAARLEARAQDYLVLATDAELTNPAPDDRLGDAINAFNEQQLGVKPVPVTPAPAAQQQQQIQPKKEDE